MTNFGRFNEILEARGDQWNKFLGKKDAAPVRGGWVQKQRAERLKGFRKKDITEAGAVLASDGHWHHSDEPGFKRGDISAFSQEELEDMLPRVKGTGERVRLSEPDDGSEDRRLVDELVSSFGPKLMNGIKKLVVDMADEHDPNHRYGREHVEQAVSQVLQRLASAYTYY